MFPCAGCFLSLLSCVVNRLFELYNRQIIYKHKISLQCKSVYAAQHLCSEKLALQRETIIQEAPSPSMPQT